MAYTTPIIDRTQTDIDTRTAKAFFNIADWIRIYRNAQLASGLASIQLGNNIPFTQVSEVPTTATFPDVVKFNTLLGNIEASRVAMIALIPTLTIAIKYNYVAGTNEQAPNYIDVNLWESTVDAIWDYWNGDALPVCPTLTADLTITTGNTNIYVDCLDAGGFNITIQDGATLAII